MKFSYLWLCELVPELTVEPPELQRLITMKTAECESIEPSGGHFASLLAVRVLSVQPLAKGKNKLVSIDAGHGTPVSVVCGAPNVCSGMMAAWLPPGTTLGAKIIGSVVVEGVESHGMLASSAELGINRDHSGLLELPDTMAPGDKLERLSPDWIIEIDNKSLTHRPDLWGHVGLAREVAAIMGKSLLDPVQSDLLPAIGSSLQVQISDHVLCPRYSALVFDNVTVGPSPLWLQARLEQLGLSAINNIVDVTNYILAELPQPMHAFDADKLSGNAIYVRPADAGESLRALNGESYTLSKSDLVIADAAGPVALAGVIGGADSAISSTTRRIVLESANFQAAGVRLTSARQKLRTDASVRFEKSLDSENTVRGLARAIDLLREICPGARIMGGLADNRGTPPETKSILLPVHFVIRKLGKDVSEEYVTGILRALGFEVNATSPGLLSVRVPSWRATKDIAVKDDLVEEVGRMIGYDEIQPVPPAVACVVPPQSALRMYLRRVRSQLASQGFTEVSNYSFITAADAHRFHFDVQNLIGVLNPIASELTHLRPSLLPGLFKNIVNNVRHFGQFRIFEIGSEIHPTQAKTLPDEIPHLAAVIYDSHSEVDNFFELKPVVECVFPAARLAAIEAHLYEHPTRTAEIIWCDVVIGRLFELHPTLLAAEGIEGRALLFEVDLALAQKIATASQRNYTPPRKYPTSGFDLSAVTSNKTPVYEVEQHLYNLGGKHLASLEFVRQYDGPPLLEGQKSVSYHLEIGALDHTLTSEEAAEIRDRIVAGMREAGFEIRGAEG